MTSAPGLYALFLNLVQEEDPNHVIFHIMFSFDLGTAPIGLLVLVFF